MARKEKGPGTTKAKKKEKKRKGSYQLPPGVKQDEYGYFTMVPSGKTLPDGTSMIKRMEVIIDVDPERGREIANKRDAFYWDPESRYMLYRGVKVIGCGPEPPRPEGLYTMTYPGFRPAHERRIRQRETSGDRGGPGTQEYVLGVDTGKGRMEPVLPKNVKLASEEKEEEEEEE